MKKITASGKTIEEAVQKALDELKVSKDQVEVTVIAQPQKGFFGLIGNKPAVIEAAVVPNPIELGKLFLEDVIKKMMVEATVKIVQNKDRIVFIIQGEKLGTLIGKRGQTLDSLQYLVNLVANRYSTDYLRIELDAENYREKRKQSLEQMAERLAKKVMRTNQPVKLEPMSAMERKIIHTALQKIKGISTYSEGEEPRRRIVVAPKSKTKELVKPKA